MVSVLIAVIAFQSKNLNPGIYTAYTVPQATQLWDRWIRSEAEGTFASKLGVTPQRLDNLRGQVWQRMIQPDLDHKPSTTEALAEKIRVAVQKDFLDAGISEKSILGQFLLCEAIADWVRTHIVYNSMLEPGKIAKAKDITLDAEFQYRMQFWTPKTLLQKNELSAVCAGMSRLTYQIGHVLKLPIYNVKGYTRGALQVNGTYTTNPRNHSWNLVVLDLPNGQRCLLSTDPTQSRVLLDDARKRLYDWRSAYAFPTGKDEVAFFHYAQFIVEIEGSQDKVEEFQPLTLSEKKWREMGSITVYDRARSEILRPALRATIDRIP